MTETGYIKVYRSLTKKGYYSDSEYVHLWIHLLMKAAYQDREYLFNGKIEYLKPGQFITGRKALRKETGISDSKVERILSCFESEHQIEQQATNKFRIITICHWSQYQNSEQQNGQQVDSKWTASGQQVDTNNKDKNIKKERIKNIYGGFVELSDDEHQKLSTKFNSKFQEVLDIFNLKIESKGLKQWRKEHKSDYATILYWDRRGWIFSEKKKGDWLV